jgi:hypothetical protein
MLCFDIVKFCFLCSFPLFLAFSFSHIFPCINCLILYVFGVFGSFVCHFVYMLCFDIVMFGFSAHFLQFSSIFSAFLFVVA